jgi:hypothetical protein
VIDFRAWTFRLTLCYKFYIVTVRVESSSMVLMSSSARLPSLTREFAQGG